MISRSLARARSAISLMQVDHIVEGHRFEPYLDPARLDPRHVQDIVDDFQ